MSSGTHSENNGHGARRADALLCAGLFIAAFALYTASAAPEFLFDDNPEFIASAYTLGVTHPPGYPLFSLFGKLFSYLAPGGVPLGVNLCAAFFGALAVALMFAALRRLRCGPAPAALFAALFGVSRVFHSQAAQAEVYASNAFFIALLFVLALGFDARRGARALLAAAAVAPLAVANHYTALLALPVIVAYALWRVRGAWNFIAPAALLCAAGFCVLTYLPLRSAAQPPVNWGQTHTARGFITHLRGVETLRDAEAVTFSEKWKFVKDYARRAGEQAGGAWLLLLAPGVWALARRRARGALTAAMFAAVTLGFFATLNYLFGPRTSYVVSFFWITSFMFLFVIAGMGAGAIFDAFRQRRAVAAVLTIVLASLVAWTAVRTNAAGDMRRNRIAAHYGRNMFRTIERDAVLFSPVVTESFPLAALRHVYGARRDAVLYGKHGDADREIGAGVDPFSTINPEKAAPAGGSLLGRLTRSRGVYLTMGALINRPDMTPVLHGLLYKLSDKADQGPPAGIAGRWARYNMEGVSLNRNNYDYLTRYVVSKYYLLRAADYIQQGRRMDAEDIFKQLRAFNPDSQFALLAMANIYIRLRDFDRALEVLEAAMKAPPEEGEKSLIPVAIYNNAGEFYRAQGRWDKAVESFENARALAPDKPLSNFQLGRTHFLYAEALAEQNAAPQARIHYKKAVIELKRTARLEKDNASIITTIALCYEKIGDWKQAEKYFKRAVKLADAAGNSDIYLDVAAMYEDRARPKDAAAMYEQWLDSVEPSVRSAEIHIKLAQIYDEAGMYHEAMTHLSKIQDYVDELEPYYKTAAYYYAGIALEETGDFERAVHAYREGAKISSGLPDIHRRYGLLLAHGLDLPGPALDQLKIFLEKDPDSPFRPQLDKVIADLQTKVKD